MSDDRRQAARTQGRFSDGKKDKNREKDKSKSKKLGQKSQAQTLSTESPALVYQENANYDLKEVLEEKTKPEELRFVGEHILSDTDNGSSRLIYEPEFINAPERDEFFKQLRDTTKWFDKNIVIRGEEYSQPRLVAWYGPFSYTYSGATLDAQEMPSLVQILKERVEEFLKANGLDVVLNSVLLNLYRNEKDSVAWHSDDELTMGVCPTIASISLGAVRKFEMRPKRHVVEEMSERDKNQTKLTEDTVKFVNLISGSLIIMDGCMQKDWLHRVPKEFHDRQPRINLTFRTVYSLDKLPSQVPYKVNYTNDIPAPTLAQQEYKLDDENFPSLNEPNKKNKKSKKDNCTNSHVPSKAGDNSGENKMDVDQNRNRIGSPSEDNQDSTNVISDKKVVSSVPKSKSFGSSNESCRESDTLEQDIPSTNEDISNEKHSEVDSSQLEAHGAPKSSLRPEAPDFVPQMPIASQQASDPEDQSFENKSWAQLADLYKNDKIQDEISFCGYIINQMMTDKSNLFSPRDLNELQVYDELFAEDTTDRQCKVILKRLMYIISRAEGDKRRRDTRNQSDRSYQEQRFRSDRSYKANRSSPRSYSGRK